MSSYSARYTRASFPALIYCGNASHPFRLIKDDPSWEDFTDASIASYIQEGTTMLIESLIAFTELDQPFNSMRAKELRFMLEALIEIKEVFVEGQIPVVQEE